MAGLLEELGVPRARILLEETGTSTLSSVRAVRRMRKAHRLRGRVVRRHQLLSSAALPDAAAPRGHRRPRLPAARLSRVACGGGALVPASARDLRRRWWTAR